MKQMIKVSFILMSLLFASTLSMIGNTKATPYGTFDVFAPTALSTLPLGYLYGPNDAMKLDSFSIGLESASPGLSGVSTQNFTSSVYSNFWEPYSNRSAFPPSNATILSVSMIAVAYVPAGPYIRMYAFKNVNGTYYSFVNGPIMYGSYWTFERFEVDLTDAYSWTASALTNTSEIRILVMAIGSGTPVYVDYVGLSYTWQYGPPPPEENGPISFGPTWTSDIFIATLAGVGFIGMIAYPALAIYSYKSKDEKLNSVVGFIVGETLFIGMLWFALSVLTGNI